RVVTLTGERFGRPGNVWVRIGTSVRWLLGQYELRPEPRQRIIMGGPMMGFTLPHADVPIVKISNCIMAPSAAELEPGDDERNCIRCGECASVCPVNLLPQQLYWFSKAGEHDKAREHQLDDCIECGACAWVCPSHIPLVHYYRVEKAEQQRLAIEAEQAERAKQRFAAKKARLEQERLEREAKHQEMIKARQAQMASQPAGEDPVAAAIARVKARQQQAAMEPTPIGTTVAPQQSSGNEDARKAAIAAAIARAKAKATPEAQAQSQAITTPQVASEQPPAGDEAKRAAVAAAIARAKAKKAQSPAEPAADLSTPVSAPEAVTSSDKDDARKAAVAAAIARAKARKAQAAEASQTNSPDPEKSE
ncbi:MAG: electron transport complex subunit RsxC, partial [Aeromonadaceae bacterium]|nr:electron transport complex subunit RsxC [Aeromonadaceae bacterium]